MAKQGEERTLTRFGATVVALMAERGLGSAAQLRAKMEAAGHEYETRQISNWLYGKRAVTPGFVKALNGMLDLNREEYERLAVDFTYGQDTKLGEDSGEEVT